MVIRCIWRKLIVNSTPAISTLHRHALLFGQTSLFVLLAAAAGALVVAADIAALVLDMLDDTPRRWHLALNFGFQELADDSNHLFLPVATIRQLGLGANTT